jgi:hypothetical protein
MEHENKTEIVTVSSSELLPAIQRTLARETTSSSRVVVQVVTITVERGASFSEATVDHTAAPLREILAGDDDLPIVEAGSWAAPEEAAEEIEENPSEAPLADRPPLQGKDLDEALRAAIDAARRRPRTSPSVLSAQYERLEVEAFDGLRLLVCPERTRCLELGLGAGGQIVDPARLEQAEAPLRALARTVRENAPEEWLLRLLGCTPSEVPGASLELLSRVFRGHGSPADMARVLALVDRYQGPPGASRADRQVFLTKYYQAHLGLSPDGFAVSYARMLHGSVTEATLYTPRKSTDDLFIGDLLRCSDGRVAVIDRVWNLLSSDTRVEVIEVRPSLGLTRTTYALQEMSSGLFRASAGGVVTEVRIGSPL